MAALLPQPPGLCIAPARMKDLPPNHPVALVGMPGAGKTTVGRLLAGALHRPFWDTDTMVVQETKRTIEDIFSSDGEAHFRLLEREALGRSLAGAPSVIATGGGAMAEDPTRAVLMARSLTIWLDVSPPTLARRLAVASPRPLLRGPRMAAKLGSMLAERRACYAQADLHIAGEDDAQTVCASILAALSSA